MHERPRGLRQNSRAFPDQSVGDIQLREQRAEANAVPEALRKLIFNGQIVSQPAIYEAFRRAARNIVRCGDVQIVDIGFCPPRL